MKTKFPRGQAVAVAREICDRLSPVTERLIVAGSLRRRKAHVGDVEILYIPRLITEPCDLFGGTRPRSLANVEIDQMLAEGVLEKRLSTTGACSWGLLNKLAVHVRSGIPVDLFATTEDAWYNYLVCRTGPAGLNTRIASEAKRLNMMWHPYGDGFSVGRFGQRPPIKIRSEREVFETVGLPYMEPWER